MKTAYNIIIVIIGCVIAYFLFMLATNSQELLSEMSSQKAELKTLNILAEKVQRLENKTNWIDTEFETFKVFAEKVQNLENKASQSNTGAEALKMLAGRIQNLEDKTSQLDTDPENLKFFADRITELEDKTSQTTTTLESLLTLKKLVEGVESDVNRLSSNVDTQNESIKSNRTQITQIGDNKVLLARIDSLESELASLQKNISSSGRSSTANTDSINSGVDAAIKALLPKFEKLTADIDSLKGADAQMADAVAAVRVNAGKNAALLQALNSADSQELKQKITAITQSLSNVDNTDSKLLRQEFGALAAQMDSLKEAIAGYKAEGKDRIGELRSVLQTQVGSLEQMQKNTRDFSEKTLGKLEDELARVQTDTAKKLEAFEESMQITLKAASGTKQDIDVSAVREGIRKEFSAELQGVRGELAELRELKGELAGLRSQIVAINSRPAPADDIPVGIVINKSFEKSLVMINTPEGTFIFNPYADFTGVIRVRDAKGNERMMLVPYTGEYLRIGNNIIDTGPFVRSCVLGINCNIDVRGSMNNPVNK